MKNQLAMCKNPYQGPFKKVLCVCEVGLLRSPTAAEVLSRPPYNFNTRACGINQEYALIPLSDALLEWADEIVVTSESTQKKIQRQVKKPVINLNITDEFNFRNPTLIQLIKKRYDMRQRASYA